MINSSSSSPSIKMSYSFEYVRFVVHPLLCVFLHFVFSQCLDLGDAAVPREIYAAIIQLSTERQYKSIPGYSTHMLYVICVEVHINACVL